jgi:hypothetical protein
MMVRIITGATPLERLFQRRQSAPPLETEVLSSEDPRKIRA